MGYFCSDEKKNDGFDVEEGDDEDTPSGP